jgi:hypothetical protein
MEHNDKLPGFLRATLDSKKKTLTLDYFVIPFPPAAPVAKAFDSVTVPW